MKVASTAPPFQVIGVGLVFDGSGRVLIDQRLEGGLFGGMWEFPGGKQEPGEAIADTIARELREELAIEVAVEQELIRLDHAYGPKRLRTTRSRPSFPFAPRLHLFRTRHRMRCCTVQSQHHGA